LKYGPDPEDYLEPTPAARELDTEELTYKLKARGWH
jgi:hypothetical protein